MFGNPETTTGGKALKFYSSMRIDIRRIGAVKEGDVVVGSRTKVKIVKNKVAAPFREAEFDIMYGEGISREGDALDLAVLHGIVDKSGAWYSFQGERIGQGRENVRAFLKENKDVFARVDSELRKKLGIGAATVAAEVPPVPGRSRRRRPRSRQGPQIARTAAPHHNSKAKPAELAGLCFARTILPPRNCSLENLQVAESNRAIRTAALAWFLPGPPGPRPAPPGPFAPLCSVRQIRLHRDRHAAWSTARA